MGVSGVCQGLAERHPRGRLLVLVALAASGIAEATGELLPAGARGRQLSVRTLLAGMHLTLDDSRPAHLTRVHAALTSLPEAGQARLGVTTTWKTGPRQLTCRQAGHTFGLITAALARDEPDGAPAQALQAACDQLLEATIPAEHARNPAALAADWTDIESWSRPPRTGSTECHDPEARWGHRNSNLPGPKGEIFFGYYLSAVTMAGEENGPAVPELARRMTICSCAPARPAPRSPSWRRCPPTASRPATSSPTPATPTASPPTGPPRCAGLARA